MNDISTDALIVRIKQGDKDAFKEIIDRHAEGVYGLCYRYCGNESEAKDLAQDVFLRAFKSIKSFRQESGFSTWIYRITTNLWLNKVKRKGIIRFISIDAPVKNEESEEIKKQLPDGSLPPEEIAEKKESDEMIQKALDRLVPGQKAAVILKYVEGKSLEEIAGICGCSWKTVGSRLSRGLKELRKSLKEKEIGF
jgi:RNA polymerase sigma-70 factor, ECF subfamily